MRRIARLDRSIGVLNPRAATNLSSPYLCAVCRSREDRFSTSSIQRAQDGGLERGLDKLRRKIWGSDKPPGLDNPYGDGSIFEEKTRQRQEKDKVNTEAKVNNAQPSKQQPKAAKVDSSYEPAETWDGLETVGGSGSWWAENWDPKHPFRSFVPAEVEARDVVITTCLHRAMVEVFAVLQAGKPLSIVSLAAPKEDITLDIQMIPTPGGVTLKFPETISPGQLLDTLSPTYHQIDGIATQAESKQIVAAGRSTADLLQLDSTQQVGDETATKEAPTESEQDVAADRCTVDPLQSDGAPRYYEDIVAAWDPSWLQISLENAGVKFAVSEFHIYCHKY